MGQGTSASPADGQLPSAQPPRSAAAPVTPSVPAVAVVAADAHSNRPTPAPAASGTGSGGAPLSLKDCSSRACAGVVDHFKRALRPPRSQSQSPPQGAGAGAEAGSAAAGQEAGATPSGDGPDTAGPAQSSWSARTEAERTTVSAAAAVAAAAAAGAGTSSDEGASGGGEGRECPPDTWQLGRATWTFLHSVAAYYPDQPTARQQELMRGMMEGLAEFYPCQICAEHLRELVRSSPPRVGSARDLNLWLCGIHNEVNEMLGKPLFDCNRLAERWRDGPPDGSCD